MGRRNRRRPLGGRPLGERPSACPTPQKVRYSSPGEAAEAARRLSLPYHPLRLSSYPCSCGGWHLSSRRP